MPDVYQLLPEIQGEELLYIQGLLKEMSEEKARQFAMIYRMRRRDPQTVLLLTLIGFLGFAGIQRFYVDQIGMGLIFLLTAGLCGIGTIIDIINYKQLSFEYNQRQAFEIKNTQTT
nr:TM2 domain-containing protein [candidate division Zixibacteria bacterium]